MTQGKTHREPLLRIAKRDGIARPKAWAIRIIAVLLSLVRSAGSPAATCRRSWWDVRSPRIPRC